MLRRTWVTSIPGNKGKKTTEVIVTSKVDYTFYPNGTVNVEVMCSNHPFRLQTEEDRSHLLRLTATIRAPQGSMIESL